MKLIMTSLEFICKFLYGSKGQEIKLDKFNILISCFRFNLLKHRFGFFFVTTRENTVDKWGTKLEMLKIMKTVSKHLHSSILSSHFQSTYSANLYRNTMNMLKWVMFPSARRRRAYTYTSITTSNDCNFSCQIRDFIKSKISLCE